ncbi:hypothetical protein HDU77_001470 [Chytriomyces hyalinus]|nr:hypothetical protein HDU77_001470 [Chytriomyces hyalinus]
MEFCGTASTATSITMISPSTVYIGSHSGDSCMADIGMKSQSLSIKDAYPNLAPIIDFVHIKIGGSGQTGAAGQGKIVACCGHGVDEYVCSERWQKYFGSLLPKLNAFKIWGKGDSVISEYLFLIENAFTDNRFASEVFTANWLAREKNALTNI